MSWLVKDSLTNSLHDTPRNTSKDRQTDMHTSEVRQQSLSPVGNTHSPSHACKPSIHARASTSIFSSRAHSNSTATALVDRFQGQLLRGSDHFCHCAILHTTSPPVAVAVAVAVEPGVARSSDGRTTEEVFAPGTLEVVGRRHGDEWERS